MDVGKQENKGSESPAASYRVWKKYADSFGLERGLAQKRTQTKSQMLNGLSHPGVSTLLQFLNGSSLNTGYCDGVSWFLNFTVVSRRERNLAAFWNLLFFFFFF